MTNKDEFLEAICSGNLREVNRRWPSAFGKNKFDDFEKWISEQKEPVSITFQFYCATEGLYGVTFLGLPDYKDGHITMTDMILRPEYQFGRVF